MQRTRSYTWIKAKRGRADRTANNKSLMKPDVTEKQELLACLIV